MKGQGAQEQLALEGKLRLLQPCSIEGDLLDLGDYPGLVDGERRVKGELYELTDLTAFKILDDYEEFDPSRPEKSIFVRRAVRLKDPEIDCWAYFYNGDPSAKPKVDAVDWSEYKRRRDG
jgi:gamma-glutamylcyclotransferase (GGCT)/AIG2-like uncharacterized protein YtfP